MGNIFEKEKDVNPVVIVLETQAEIDQLFVVLNYTPIAKMLFDGNDWWRRAYRFLQTRKTPAYHKYHEALEEFLGDS